MIFDVGLANIAAEFDQESEAFFISKSSLSVLVEAATRHIDLDDEWYISQYPDVKDAIAQGHYENARQHYIEHGFMECRLPFRIEVDEDFYLQEYEDVAAFIADKKIPSAQWHFENHGRAEGRIPFDGFSILENPVPRAPGALAVDKAA